MTTLVVRDSTSAARSVSAEQKSTVRSVHNDIVGANPLHVYGCTHMRASIMRRMCNVLVDAAALSVIIRSSEHFSFTTSVTSGTQTPSFLTRHEHACVLGHV